MLFVLQLLPFMISDVHVVDWLAEIRHRFQHHIYRLYQNSLTDLVLTNILYFFKVHGQYQAILTSVLPCEH